MSLHYLPNELILSIIKSIKRPIDLSCLARCSRRYQSVVTPILYSEIDASHIKVVPLLLRTMLSNTYLASLPKSFHVVTSKWGDRRYRRPWESITFSARELWSFNDAVAPGNILEYWKGVSVLDSWGAMTAL